MKKHTFWKAAGILLTAVGIWLTSVATVASPENKLVIQGSTTVLPIAQKAAEIFMKKNPHVNITVRGGGSGIGITSLLDGTCDIANSSRAVKITEIQKAQAKSLDLKPHVIAKDGIAVIVHPTNRVNGLTRKQIADIYTGKINFWSQVRGENTKIVVVSRDSASGTFEAFGELALGGAKVRPDALLQASNQAVASVVARTPGAIGYVGLGYLSDAVKAITVDGVEVTQANVLSGKYPLSRPLFMYTSGTPAGDVKNFLDFVMSIEGQRIVREEGFVPLK